MACKSCGLDITNTVCQVCEALLAPSPPLCKQCGAPLSSGQRLGPFCHVCNTMFETVRGSRWLTLAQARWEEENYELDCRKRGLMGSPEKGQDSSPS
jgi:predicted amidophosphoribosyltransferase